MLVYVWRENELGIDQDSADGYAIDLEWEGDEVGVRGLVSI
jgi:hypothetical protein